MASTARLCIGNNAVTQSSGMIPRIVHVNNAAQPWFPSTSTPGGDNDSRNFRTMEIFWYVNLVPTSSDFIISCRRQSDNAAQIQFFCSSASGANGTMRWVVRNHLNTTVTVDTVIDFSLSGALNAWLHTVFYREAANSSALWRSYTGRVGIAKDGSATEADSWPYPWTGTSAGGGTGDDRMRGFRNLAADTMHITMGGSIATFTGTTVSQATALMGGYSELRAWADNRSFVSPTGPDGFIDLRNQFIDATQFPTLIHCFRFNENSATATDFDDVGFKDARFVTSVLNFNFPSHPFPNTVTDTAFRAGSYKLISTPESTRAGIYNVRRLQEAFRGGNYKVLRLQEHTRVGDYKVFSNPTAERIGSYKVNSTAELQKAGSYEVQPVSGPDEIARLGQYKVNVPGEASRIGSYAIGSTPEATRVGSYKVFLGSPTLSRDGSYKIIAIQSENRIGTYKVVNFGTATRDGEYRIAGQSDTVTIQRAGRYFVLNQAAAGELALRKLAELRSRTR